MFLSAYAVLYPSNQYSEFAGNKKAGYFYIYAFILLILKNWENCELLKDDLRNALMTFGLPLRATGTCSVVSAFSVDNPLSD